MNDFEILCRYCSDSNESLVAKQRRVISNFMLDDIAIPRYSVILGDFIFDRQS